MICSPVTATNPSKFHRAITLGGAICLGIPTSILSPSAGLASPTVQVMNLNITQAEVIAAQNGLCDALLNISSTYANPGKGAATKKQRLSLTRLTHISKARLLLSRHLPRASRRFAPPARAPWPILLATIPATQAIKDLH